MRTKRRLPLTSAGDRRFVVVPSPSWPDRFRPQQYAAPLASIPHVWSVPVAISTKDNPPATCTGSARFCVVPSPSSPKRLKPQQYATPSVVRPHVLVIPATSCWNLRVPETGADRLRSVVVPSPSSPLKLPPQQCAAPVASSAHVWPVPKASWLRRDGATGGTPAKVVTATTRSPTASAIVGASDPFGSCSLPSSNACSRSPTKLAALACTSAVVPSLICTLISANASSIAPLSPGANSISMRSLISLFGDDCLAAKTGAVGAAGWSTMQPVTLSNSATAIGRVSRCMELSLRMAQPSFTAGRCEWWSHQNSWKVGVILQR